ncbi:MAG: HAMP domain-containing protein [Anaerolineales bacterium]|nr:HAMP domain-containing protein [Anaerolineales bacterium]
MRSLRTKMTLAFLITSLIGVVIVSLLVRSVTVRAFDTLVRNQQISTFSDRVSSYYQENGSWDGVLAFVRRGTSNVGGAANTQSRGQGGGPQQGLAVQPYGLADIEGIVLIPVGQLSVGDTVPDDLLKQSAPLEVDGVEVGLLLNNRQRPQYTHEEEIFREKINQAATWAAVGVCVLALIVSIILARAITRPVHEMTVAAEEITGGNMDQQVPVRTKDELGKLAQAFNRMSLQLDKANKAREQMTADIAHDLRTPLTVISGHLEGLIDGVLKPSPERFDLMFKETQQLQRMVQDLRTLSLTDAGELKLYKHPVEIREILERAVQAYTHQAEAKGVQLSMHYSEGIPPVQADPQRLAQVMDNLISNALRYTKEGGQIILGSSLKQDSVEITVSDTGKGIHPNNLPYVFERFYRSDTARFQRDGESGLGLAIVKGIVEEHGGTIRVDSEYGAGTVFTISLPLGG